MDTLDYRYYRAALDAARVDQTVVNFNMGLWCDRTPVKPILEVGCTKDGDCAEDDICVVNVACPLIEDFDADGNCLLSK